MALNSVCRRRALVRGEGFAVAGRLGSDHVEARRRGTLHRADGRFARPKAILGGDHLTEPCGFR